MADALSPDFSQKAKETLAKRVAQTCSNPSCLNPTSGAHTDPTKSMNVGEAAHIYGARVGAKRFDPSMTNTERRNEVNGIWLCRKCAKLIDSDEQHYSAGLLFEWKQNAEQKVLSQLEGRSDQKFLLETELEFFSDTSLFIQNIVISRPPYWEYLLAINLLRKPFDGVKRQFDELQKDLVVSGAKLLPDEQFANWSLTKMDDLSCMIEVCSKLFNRELPEAFGPSGISGDPVKIKRFTELTVRIAHGFFDWEVDLKFTHFSTNFENVKKELFGWAMRQFFELYRVLNEFEAIFRENDKPEGQYRLTAVFQLPEADAFNLALERLKQERF